MKRSFLTLWTILYASMLFAQSTLRHLTVADGLPNNQVRQIIELPNGQILVATEGYFSLFNGRNFVTLECNLDSVYRLPDFGGYTFMWEGDSILWLKDYYSLYKFNTRTRRFEYSYPEEPMQSQLHKFVHEHTSTTANNKRHNARIYMPKLDSIIRGTELEGEYIQDYRRDRNGGQWFGLSYNGVLYQKPPVEQIQVIDIGVDDVPRHMISLGGSMMLIAGERGIYEFDSKEKKITRTLAQDYQYPYEMCRDPQGRTWISTSKGLYCYENGQIRLYDMSNVDEFMYPHVRFAIPVDDRRLLVSNYLHNLGYFYPEQKKFKKLYDKIPEIKEYRTMITATTLSNRNHAAICTQNGLFVLDMSADTIMQPPAVARETHYSRKYNCILFDRVGRLWVGTQNGLLVSVGDKVKRITTTDGLSNACIQSLAEDHAGCIWVGTSNGINRIRTDASAKNIQIRSLSTEDGLPEGEITERGICIMPDGTLYLATPVGLAAIKTSSLLPIAKPINVELVGLNVGGEPMPLDSLPLSLNHRQNFIELQVSALNYVHPMGTRYRYRLLKLDDTWHYTTNDGSLNTIRYEALSPGTYTIEVQASTGDNIWGPALHKTFIINPPLWLTWWAKLMYFIIAAATVYVLLNLYLQYRKRKLERENEMRVNQLFELREEARKQFAQAVEIENKKIEDNPEEQQLIERVMKALGKNMANTEYTVDMLANDIGMSRANLYKKMQTMIGITPNDYMRNVRLKKAAELLAKSDIPVNQISLLVGFQTPRYFSQCFRKMFGVTPSEYREGKVT